MHRNVYKEVVLATGARVAETVDTKSLINFSEVVFLLREFHVSQGFVKKGHHCRIPECLSTVKECLFGTFDFYELQWLEY